ncbi:centrin-2-like isoform X2 [Cynara cardunculus var. scolymus]|uniref:centrin-2-like isoform X2 n=1 Tax=Cynara cardunculus var. scolymus TaxID=59895 RepID=UPI000D623BC2|nr:centrin-2-like isoform X2 [Cynara cardunculus var. scolymus]
MVRANQSDSETEETGSDLTPQRNGTGGSENMTDYEKQRMKRIEENKARMKAMGLDKMASSLMGSVPISQNAKKKGKKKVGLEDDEEYKPSGKDEELSSSSGSDGDDYDDEFRVSRTKPKVKNSTPSRKIPKLSGNSDFVDDDDDALMKAIALSLQDSPGFLDVASKTPPQNSDANASIVENIDRKQIISKDDSGKRKRKNSFTSRVQMSEDELILHFFQFDGKGGINLRDVRRIAASHDFMWTDEEMENMIRFFDSDGDGKLSLEDFTKIVDRCNMRQGSENAGRASPAS